MHIHTIPTDARRSIAVAVCGCSDNDCHIASGLLAALRYSLPHANAALRLASREVSFYVCVCVCVNSKLFPTLLLFRRIFFLTPKNTPHLRYKGGWLFTSPGDECLPAEGRLLGLLNNFPDNESTDGGGGANEAMQWVREGGW